MVSIGYSFLFCIKIRSGIIRNKFKKYPAIWKVALTALIVTALLFAYLEWQTTKESIEMLETSNTELVSSNKELYVQAEMLSKTNEELHIKTDGFVETLAKQEQEMATMKEDNSSLKKSIEEKDAEIKRISELRTIEVTMLQKKLKIEQAKKEEQPVVSRGVSKKVASVSSKTITVTATAYTAYCNGCSGTTATGINLRANPDLKVIAVDPKVIPLGSKVYIEGYGHAVAGDTGGAIKGNKVDLFMSSKKSALSFGRQTVQVKILN